MKFDRKMKVYVYGEPIDMRLGFERLSYFVREEMGKDLDVGDLFLFLGKNRHRLKGLRFDGSGLILLTKRMEKKKGFMNVRDLDGRIELSHEELELILHGSVLRKYLPTRRTKLKNIFHGATSVC